MNIVRIFNAHPKYRRRHEETILLIRHVLKGEKCSRAEINVIFNDDKEMRKLNTAYLGHRYATDVISFSLDESKQSFVSGEVYVNIDQASRQAQQYNVSLRNELGRLAVHGVLHLLGYDDSSKQKKEIMTHLENRYLQYF